MGYNIELFLDQNIDKEYICSICQDVLKSPFLSTACEHIYCSTCIQQWRLSSNTCPIDRQPITGLTRPIRPFMNLYNQLQLKCGFEGCGSVCNLGDIESHAQSCQYNQNPNTAAVTQAPQGTSTSGSVNMSQEIDNSSSSNSSSNSMNMIDLTYDDDDETEEIVASVEIVAEAADSSVVVVCPDCLMSYENPENFQYHICGVVNI